MDALLADFVRETTATTGAGLTLVLTADAKFARFSDVFSVGDIVYYTIQSGSGENEQGTGTVQAGNTLDRTTPLVTFAGGVYDNNTPSKITLSGVSYVAIAPSSSIILDTIYDDTSIQNEVNLNTAKETNIAHPLVETAVPVGAVFTDTDTVYTHPTTDGNLHVSATSTTNEGNVLTAGPTAGSFSWQPPNQAGSQGINFGDAFTMAYDSGTNSLDITYTGS